MLCYTDHCYDTDRLHGLFLHIYDYHISYYYAHHAMDSRHITVTPACRISLFLSYGSSFRLPVLLFPVIRCMLYACFPLLILLIPLLDTCSRYWYGCSRYWTRELLICYTWNPTSIVPVSSYIVHVILFPFPVIVLRYQQSSGPVIMLPISCIVLVLVTLYTWHMKS